MAGGGLGTARARASDRTAPDVDAGGKGRQIRVADYDLTSIGRNALSGYELACSHGAADIDILSHADVAVEIRYARNVERASPCGDRDRLGANVHCVAVRQAGCCVGEGRRGNLRSDAANGRSSTYYRGTEGSNLYTRGHSERCGRNSHPWRRTYRGYIHSEERRHDTELHSSRRRRDFLGNQSGHLRSGANRIKPKADAVGGVDRVGILLSALCGAESGGLIERDRLWRGRWRIWASGLSPGWLSRRE